MKSCLIHITPELPPSVGGVADYTAILSRRLDDVLDGEVELVLLHAGWRKVDALDVSFPAYDLSGACSAQQLVMAIDDVRHMTSGRTTVLLEYSGYGYARRGAPLWLLRGLRRACGQDLPLFTIFHELYGTNSKPWTSAFWMSAVQQFVARNLVRLSNGMMANWEEATTWLRQRADDKPVQMSPSFSNVGEPESLPPYSGRQPYAVCFGGGERKAALYEDHGSSIDRLLDSCRIKRIVDIGSKPKEVSLTRVETPVELRGILSTAEISTVLRNASLGILEYPLHCLTKSGIWASYAAHGVPTLIAAEPFSASGIVEGQHFIRLQKASSLSLQTLEQVGAEALAWYKHNADSQRVAKRIKNLIGT